MAAPTNRDDQAWDKKKTKPKPTKAATAWAAPRTIFIPPAFTDGGKASPKKTAKKKDDWPGRRGAARPKQTPYEEAVNRREVSLGLPKKGRVSANVADAVPAVRKKSGALSLKPFGRSVGVVTAIADAVEGKAKSAAVAAGEDILNTLGAMQSGRTAPANPLPQPVQRLTNAAGPLSSRTVKTTSATADALLGKSIPNLIQGQPPKNWKDVAGLGIGVATVVPMGRLGKVAAAIAKASAPAKREAMYTRAAKRIAAAHSVDEISAQRNIIAKEIAKKGDGDVKHLQVQDNILSRAQDLFPKHGPKTLNETVQDALPGMREAREAQDAGYSVVRGQRASAAVKAFNEAGGGLEGEAAFFQQLKGELPKVPYEGGLKDLTPATLSHMFNRISDAYDSGVLREFEMGRAMRGLRKASEGITPQPSERALIEKVFGEETAAALTDPENLTKMAWLKHHWIDVWNLPRSLQASLDLSAPFRQGLVLGMRHPVVFGKNFAPMIKALRSNEYADDVIREINSRPYADLADRAKLAKTQTHGADISSREEMIPSPISDKIPGIRGSARAYTVFLNKMRADVFDMMIDQAKAAGKNYEDPKFLKALGEFLNTATGRGNLGWHKFEESADLLNSFLFSPRLLASRIQILNPNYYARMYKADPWLAKEALQTSLHTLGAISAFLYMGSLVPGVSVGLDPRSANFGKMRIRNTRIDVAAGFIPVINLASRLISGETVSSATGEVKELSGEFGESSYLDVLTRFARSKLAPSPGAVVSLLDQRTFTGSPVTPRNTLLPLIFPLNMQGAHEAYQTEGGSLPFGAAAYGLGSIGFGVNSYPDKVPGKSGKATKDKSSWKKPSGPGGATASLSKSDKSSWKKP